MLSPMPTMRRRTGLFVALASSSAIARAFTTGALPVETTRSRTKADDWDADRYSTNAGFVPELGKTVLDLLAPLSGECILDVGCGDGVLTAELKGRGCTVVGIDFSPDMVAAAVKRNVDAYVMDASAIDAPFLLSKIANRNTNTNEPRHESERTATTTTTTTTNSNPKGGLNTDTKIPPLTDSRGGGVEVGVAGAGGNDRLGGLERPPAFDAVFTNAALHWVRAPRTVIEGARRVLRPGGRFVGEFGGHGNMAAVRVAMHAALWRRGVDPLKVDPWYFPTPREYGRLLEAAGFIVDDIVLVPRPTVLPAGTGMRGWLATFTQAFLNALPEDPSCAPSSDTNQNENGLTGSKAEVVDEALAALQPALCDKDGIWTADYVRLRFRAHLPLDGAGGSGGIAGEGDGA